MILKIELKENCERIKRFKGKETIFNFTPGINFIVGRNGTGKSTIIRIINDYIDYSNKRKKALSYAKEEKERKEIMERYDFEKKENIIFEISKEKYCIYSFDGEYNNRTSDAIYSGADVISRFMSHGEYVIGILNKLKEAEDKSIFILDEPENALDFENLIILTEIFKSFDNINRQIICVTHNPVLINSKKYKKNFITLDGFNVDNYIKKYRNIFK